MKTSKLDYKLPEELIAENPITPRDAARLMVLDKKSKKITESTFASIGDFLKAGDVLVFNKSRVFAARTKGKKENGKLLEVFFLAPLEGNDWKVLIGGKIKDGSKIDFKNGLTGRVKKGFPVVLRLNKSPKKVYEYLDEYGSVPLPPYIKRRPTKHDKTDYQNVFAKALGSAAAPTAGLHFTKNLLLSLKKRGVIVEYVTLHVGLGTFAPIKSQTVEGHEIHKERYSVSGKTKKNIEQAISEGRRVVACGTTSLRVLESMRLDGKREEGETGIYIYPGYSFRVVGALITNFHTPKSSLLALVWAFGGERLLKKAYRLAIRKEYRFFSYGDGMLIT